ncbi:PaaI family thioesterase [Cognatishimia maritima]|uniref:Uncharacterized domain 1-containing protein n=1 Tax=Cognatishimia maritima TaxID=870908 RepID=A0A1M5UB19_9RHOB|nr:PaaI family thioesterase [Cognatishimia maritima]SHH60212.1 uncharacterized domain 1-containing protein [Cognatishimia maritima]
MTEKMTPINPELIEGQSAFQTHLGYQLTHWGEGHARLEQPLSPFLMNRIGIPHGGNYATLLDTVMGFSGVYTGQKNRRLFAITMSLTVNFVAQPDGDTLFAEGRVVGGGNRSFFAEGRIFDENGVVVAHGSGAFQRREGAMR